MAQRFSTEKEEPKHIHLLQNDTKRSQRMTPNLARSLKSKQDLIHIEKISKPKA